MLWVSSISSESVYYGGGVCGKTKLLVAEEWEKTWRAKYTLQGHTQWPTYSSQFSIVSSATNPPMIWSTREVIQSLSWVSTSEQYCTRWSLGCLCVCVPSGSRGGLCESLVLQAIVSHLIWVLKSELWSSTRAFGVLNHRATQLIPNAIMLNSFDAISLKIV